MLTVMSVEDAMMGLWLLGVDKVMGMVFHVDPIHCDEMHGCPQTQLCCGGSNRLLLLAAYSNFVTY